MTRPLLAAAAIAALCLTGCVTAAVAGGVFVVGIGSAILFSSCDEPASVQVWDNTSAYPVCDAVVTAESESGSTATFSPCYQAYLGTGVWHVTATKPGFPVAKGNFQTKKEMLAAIGSNLILKDKILLIEASKPFLILETSLSSAEGKTGPIEPENIRLSHRRKRGDAPLSPRLL